MRVLLDECVPARLRLQLPEHEVQTVPGVGWAGISNGELLREIDAIGQFDALVTVDKNLPSQQSIETLSFGVVVLRVPSNSIDDILPLIPDLRKALQDLRSEEVLVLGG